ncbi:phosphoribosyltransferase [Hydrogenobacter hydrogenophilus]|uniref:Predicted phosphoribosyltransferase n=1 Tax=Hydrogenobacter hydrogenophilus TaxID=35835 RepID=A0A285NWK3_9AQUI|nr:phosphoribosyltransferase [Hydrogenobacter hydrogenophilus]SNZ13864.1 Predicted phosphoribosyltransferase [Hydrogenobacter hydrogenophilus]
MIFSDRTQAGKVLGEYLKDKIDRRLNPIVLGIPRGGVVVAKEVAKILNVPMSLLIVRKLGVPQNPELAFGAVDKDGEVYIDKKTVDYFRLSEDQIRKVVQEEMKKIREREKLFLKGGVPDLSGREVIIVDDGIATGYTVIAGVNFVKRRGAQKVIVASPVCPADTWKKIKEYADEVFCYHVSHEPNFAVGMFYRDFRQVEDQEVLELLQELNPQDA